MRALQTSIFDNDPIPSSPKQLVLVTTTAKVASDLNAKWHSRLPEIHWSNIVRNRNFKCYIAKFKFKTLAVAIWSSPVSQTFDLETVLELRRLAISPDAPKFTATWMLGKMVKRLKIDLPNINRLISYQDEEVHKGTIYKAGNWVATSKVPFRTWTLTRQRNPDQSQASKTRWEYHLKERGVENEKCQQN
jgi:hypothetical protein